MEESQHNTPLKIYLVSHGASAASCRSSLQCFDPTGIEIVHDRQGNRADRYGSGPRSHSPPPIPQSGPDGHKNGLMGVEVGQPTKR